MRERVRQEEVTVIVVTAGLGDGQDGQQGGAGGERGKPDYNH
jgi:hypothetical protein